MNTDYGLFQCFALSKQNEIEDNEQSYLYIDLF